MTPRGCGPEGCAGFELTRAKKEKLYDCAETVVKIMTVGREGRGGRVRGRAGSGRVPPRRRGIGGVPA